jgi:hypothetical protein
MMHLLPYPLCSHIFMSSFSTIESERAMYSKTAHCVKPWKEGHLVKWCQPTGPTVRRESRYAEDSRVHPMSGMDCLEKRERAGEEEEELFERLLNLCLCKCKTTPPVIESPSVHHSKPGSRLLLHNNFQVCCVTNEMRTWNVKMNGKCAYIFLSLVLFV